jgi:hypothetical protein
VRQLKFDQAGLFGSDIIPVLTTIKNEKVKEVSQSLNSNIGRVISHWELPVVLYRLLRNWKAVLQDHGNSTYQIIQQNRQRRRRDENLLRARLEAPEREEVGRLYKEMEERAKFPGGVDTGLEEFHEVANGILARLPGASIDRVFVGLEVVLSGIIVGVWTAYESLATDLWITAVNQQPMTLGVNALYGKRNATAKAEPTDAADPEHKEKVSPLNIDILQEYGFDLSSSLGSMIHRKRKFTFNTLDDINHAYNETFCVRQKGVRKGPHQAVKSWFSGEEYNGLRVLEALRHVLVHKAGMVDEQFLNRVRDLSPAFTTLKVGDSVELDGEMVREYASAAVKRALVLLRGVDKWLDESKKK